MKAHTRQLVCLMFPLLLLTRLAKADSFIYAVNSAQQFGTINLSNGSFQPIGAGLPEYPAGLAAGPGGSLLTTGFGGDLYSIDPATGAVSHVGATGLGACFTPADPCGPSSQNSIGSYKGVLYATDFANNLYKLDSKTGAATLIGATGVPAVPAVPFTINPDGSANLFEENLFSSNGKFYLTFDAFSLNFGTGAVTTAVPLSLYTLDPLTGASTLVGTNSDQFFDAAGDINGTIYGFNAGTSQLFTLDPLTVKATYVVDAPDAGLVSGLFAVTPVPEPAPLALVGTGLAALAALRRRRGQVEQA